MKQPIQKLFSILIACLASHAHLFATLQNGFYQYQIADKQPVLVFINTIRFENQDTNELQHFKKIALETGRYIAYAHDHHLDIAFVIDDVFGEISQLDQHAAISEGSRVALTWLSAYYRFNETPVENINIYLISKTASSLNEADIDEIISSRYMEDMYPLDSIKEDRKATCKTKQSVNINKEAAFEKCIQYMVKIDHRPFNIQPFVLPTSQKSTTSFDITSVPVLNDKQRIVITGAAGFLGSHLSKRFLDEGHTVIGLDNLSCCSGKNIESLKQSSRFHFIRHDAAEAYDFNQPIDCIIHAASVPSPEYYYKMPTETLKSGLHGIDNALELAYKHNARLMFTSTSEVYGDPSISPQPESYAGNVSPIGKRSQYDESKRGAETLICLSYKQQPLDVRIARIFNTYGPGMELNDGRVITNFIQATLSNKQLTIYGDGLQTRSFCYVDDLVDGLVALTTTERINPTSLFENRICNIGNPVEFTINECASVMQDVSQAHLSHQPSIHWINNPDATDPKQRKPNIAYASELLGFNPKISLQTGLEKTFLHFKELQ